MGKVWDLGKGDSDRPYGDRLDGRHRPYPELEVATDHELEEKETQGLY